MYIDKTGRFQMIGEYTGSTIFKIEFTVTNKDDKIKSKKSDSTATR